MRKNLFITLAALLCSLPLSANIRPAPGQFGVKGEWLYFYPAIEDTYYVVESTTSTYPQGEKKNNLFCYESGYRVEAIYAFCNCINDVRVRWTQLLQNSHTVDVIAPFQGGIVLYPTEFTPLEAVGFGLPINEGSAGSEVTMSYYALEAMLGQLIYDCSPFTFEFEAGIQYAHVKFKEATEYVGITHRGQDSVTTTRIADLQFEDTFSGIGPEMAFEGDYALYNSDCCCPGTLYLTSSLRGALLIGHNQEKYGMIGLGGTDSAVRELYNVENKKAWHVVPWWDMKLGFNYTSAFDCFTVSVEAGYEAGCYINAISKERFTDDLQSGYSFDHFQNFTYHGPYVAVEVMF